MQRFFFHFLLLALCCAPGLAFPQKTLNLDDCFVFFKFYPLDAEGFQYLNDGKRYVQVDQKGMHVHHVDKPGRDSLLQLSVPELGAGFDAFTFNASETRLLLRTETEPVYRHSVLANYYTYDFRAKKAVPLFPDARQQFAEFSPDGDKVAFVAGNNLYCRDLSSGDLTQITRDGAANQVINGLPDWVYEEEFSPVDGDGMVATRWSPDGSKIAFLRFEEAPVRQYSLYWYENEMYPRRTSFKYPKVGEKNSTVSAHVYDLKTGALWRADTGADTDIYLPRLYWTPDNRLVVMRLNRFQDTLDLLLYNLAGGSNATLQPALLLRETDAAYVEIEKNNKVYFLNDGRHFILMSEQSGFNHLYLYDLTGKQVRALTEGNFDVTAFYGADEKNGKLYYQTATPTPLDRQVWEGSLQAPAQPRLMTPGTGTHDAVFSPTFDYYTLTRSDADTPPVATLCERTGKEVRTLVDNRRTRRLREEYGFVKKEFFSFPLADGATLNGWMLKPAALEPGRKYPILFDIYGGPGSQTVQNQYDGYLDPWRQLLVQKGIIVVSVDNRGTGGRGRDFKKITQLQLGKLETEDQISAARYLSTLPYIDGSRIGITGSSFGGYLASSCVLKGADVFKLAIAVSPVTNWKWYDSAYTERYMHTLADNKSGYEENSPINFVDRLRGDNYLLCHGMADDNVHWQHAVEMTNALIRAGKQFDTYYYPNRNHGIYGENATRHLFTKLTDYLLEKL